MSDSAMPENAMRGNATRESAGPSAVEHGISDVAGPKRRELTTGQKLGLAALTGTVALGLIWFNALLTHHAPRPEKPDPVGVSAGEPYTPPPPLPLTHAALPLPALTGSDPSLAGKPTPASAPILAFSGGGGLRQPASSMPPVAGADLPAATPTPDTSVLARKLTPTVLVGARASRIKNPDMVITEGTLIPCILQTAINTELAGFVTCVVPVDVRGTTGHVVLLDRGTRIVGQIETGLVQGQSRVFVLWTRAETPKHVVIALDAPGADQLGRAGFPGAVDNHWWQRFGGALMLTLVQGSLNAGTALAAGSGNNGSGQAALGFVYGAQSSGEQVANTALQHSINIPPTLVKNQGDTVSVFVVRDLDFSGVYRLKIAQGRP